MNQEKSPSLDVTPGKGAGPGRVKSARTIHQPESAGKRINYYPAGIIIEAGGGMGDMGSPAAGHVWKRGKIKGWSRSSRRRMRRFMVCHVLPDDWLLVDTSLTIPGDLSDDDMEKRLFSDWSWRAVRAGWAVVWRLEIQSRDVRHWHCIVGLPPGQGGQHTTDINTSWWDAVERLGPYHGLGVVDGVGYRVQDWRSRMAIGGAHAVSCLTKCQPAEGGSSWMRYMMDHASKTKQHQVAYGKGRHWGVINRKCFERALSECDDLTDDQFFKWLRMYQRLVTRSHVKQGVPFGRCLRRRARCGRYGQTVRFTHKETVRRLVDLVRHL